MTTCAEFEILLADHIDGVLAPDMRAEFTCHLESCPACAAYARDAMEAVSFMERAAEPEMPPVLMSKILQSTNSGWELTLRGKGIRGSINRFFAPILQPRFVLGAVFTIMSATMLTQCAGVPKTALGTPDLDPAHLWTALENKGERIWDRGVKSYESMRLVYEVKSQLTEWSQQQSEKEDAAADASANGRKLEATPVKPGETRK
jgi:hypothetical protein